MKCSNHFNLPVKPADFSLKYVGLLDKDTFRSDSINRGRIKQSLAPFLF